MSLFICENIEATNIKVWGCVLFNAYFSTIISILTYFPGDHHSYCNCTFNWLYMFCSSKLEYKVIFWFLAVLNTLNRIMAVLKIDDNNVMKCYEPAMGIPHSIIFRYWSVDSLAWISLTVSFIIHGEILELMYFLST